jgi:hypothetical protein
MEQQNAQIAKLEQQNARLAQQNTRPEQRMEQQAHQLGAALAGRVHRGKNHTAATGTRCHKVASFKRLVALSSRILSITGKAFEMAAAKKPAPAPAGATAPMSLMEILLVSL